MSNGVGRGGSVRLQTEPGMIKTHYSIARDHDWYGFSKIMISFKFVSLTKREDQIVNYII